MKVIDPGKSAGGENFRGRLGFDIGKVMRSDVLLSAESGANFLSLNTTKNLNTLWGDGQGKVYVGGYDDTIRLWSNGA